ncbi:MAG: sialidase family protein, partial [Opitutaceae bacterium]
MFLTLAGLGVARAAGAAHAHGGMGGDRAAQAELGAQAAFDAKGVLWAAHKVSGHIAVSRSEDLGRTWLNPVLVTPAPEQTDTGADARPKIALGPGGGIYVTWTRPMTKPYTGEIKFSRSVDGGRSFSAPVVVHRDRQEITHRFDSIAVNTKGQVIVAWIDKRDLMAAATAKGPAYRGAAVYFAVSDDHGATFRGDYKLADNSCECCRIALVCHADGGVTARPERKGP